MTKVEKVANKPSLLQASSQATQEIFEELRNAGTLESKFSSECTKIAGVTLKSVFSAKAIRLQSSVFTDKDGKVSKSVKLVLRVEDSSPLNGREFSAKFTDIERADEIEAGTPIKLSVVEYPDLQPGKRYFVASLLKK